MNAADIEQIKNEARKEVLEEFASIMKDFMLLSNNPSEFDAKKNKLIYESMKKQIEVMQPLNFGININVLMMADRLFGCMQGLSEYLSNSKDISVDTACDYVGVLEVLKKKKIDIFIMVGLLAKTSNYESIKAVRKANRNACIIKYAYLSNVINDMCTMYNIEFKFERKEPLDRFYAFMVLSYMENLKLQNRNSVKLQPDYIEQSKIGYSKLNSFFMRLGKSLFYRK